MTHKRYNMFAVFAIFTTLFAVVGIVLIFVLAITSPDSFDTYPSYTYAEYIDKSNSATIEENEGAQLLEAETFSLTGQAKKKENLGASKKEEVTNLSRSSSLSVSFTSDASYNAKLTIAISFLSNNGKSASASSLFSLFINGKEVSMQGVEILPCYNENEYLENDVGVLSLEQGLNLLELVSSSNSRYSIDYFVLTPQKERTIQKGTQTLHHDYTYTYLANNGQQVLEAELGERKGVLLLSSDKASDGYQTYFTQENDTLTLYINSSAQANTTLDLALSRIQGDNDPIGLSITLNDQEIFFGNKDELKEETELLSFGNISLRRDKNILTISDITGRFLLDYLLLNKEINYSSNRPNQRYEAEDAILTNANVLSEETASRKKIVSDFSFGGALEFDISTILEDQSYASLRIGYEGSPAPLGELMDISLNGSELNLSNIYTEEKTEEDTFQDVCLGSLSLKRGRNVILIHVLSFDSLSIDYLNLYYSSLSETTNLSLEAESILPATDKRIFYSKYASNERAVKLSPDSFSFYFQSNHRSRINIMLSLCFLSGGENVSDCLSISLNEEEVSLIDVKRPTIASERFYTSLNIGNGNVQEGLNILTITAKDSTFLLDTISLNE